MAKISWAEIFLDFPEIVKSIIFPKEIHQIPCDFPKFFACGGPNFLKSKHFSDFQNFLGPTENFLGNVNWDSHKKTIDTNYPGAGMAGFLENHDFCNFLSKDHEIGARPFDPTAIRTKLTGRPAAGRRNGRFSWKWRRIECRLYAGSKSRARTWWHYTNGRFSKEDFLVLKIIKKLLEI